MNYHESDGDWGPGPNREIQALRAERDALKAVCEALRADLRPLVERAVRAGIQEMLNREDRKYHIQTQARIAARVLKEWEAEHK